MLSPTRGDAIEYLDKTPDINVRTYKEIMLEQKLENERQETLRKVAK